MRGLSPRITWATSWDHGSPVVAIINLSLAEMVLLAGSQAG